MGIKVPNLSEELPNGFLNYRTLGLVTGKFR